MTGRAAFVAALLFCAGCLTSSTPVPKTWVVSPTGVKPPAARQRACAAATSYSSRRKRTWRLSMS